MRMTKAEKINKLITRMKERCTRYKDSSDDPQLLKNDLDIIFGELKELQEVYNCPYGYTYQY